MRRPVISSFSRVFLHIWRLKLQAMLQRHLPPKQRRIPLPLLLLPRLLLLPPPLLLQLGHKTFSRYVSPNSQHGSTKPRHQLAQQQQQQATTGGAGGMGGAVPQLDIAALQANPQIQQLRELLQSNPALIQPMIQQIVASNPQLGALIQSNPEALIQLLGGAEGDEEGAPPGSHVVHVTEEERAAIERVSLISSCTVSLQTHLFAQLEALGFPRQAVLEAYFACDKNEELAANYLFEGGFED